jgi:hypothetical protein
VTLRGKVRVLGRARTGRGRGVGSARSLESRKLHYDWLARSETSWLRRNVKLPFFTIEQGSQESGVSSSIPLPVVATFARAAIFLVVTVNSGLIPLKE